MIAYLTAHALVIATTLACLVMLSRLSRSDRTPQSTFAWLLGFAFVPVIAIPLYFALGSRKFPRRAKGPTLGVPPVRHGHSFELLTTGDAAYARLLALVRGAEHSIDLTMFILGDDATGHAFVDALAECAARGVKVRVILDAVGSFRMRRRAGRALEGAGAQLRAFMPLRHSPVRGRTNLRSHRKLAVIDGALIFTGGMNLANEYMGLPLPPGGAPRWRDVAAVARGPIVADAAAMFASDWAFCGGSPRLSTDTVPARSQDTQETQETQEMPAGGGRMRIVPSGPDMLTDTVYDLFLSGIFDARERVAIVTPYYVPDEALQHALVLSARRGVKTELLVPARSNHVLADLARQKLLRELTANGVIVHYYGGGMVHAKAMVIDDTFAYVGSPNFDMRSLFLNYENALCVYSSPEIAEIRGFVDALFAECGPFTPPAEHPLVEQIALLLAPEL